MADCTSAVDRVCCNVAARELTGVEVVEDNSALRGDSARLGRDVVYDIDARQQEVDRQSTPSPRRRLRADSPHFAVAPEEDEYPPPRRLGSHRRRPPGNSSPAAEEGNDQNQAAATPRVETTKAKKVAELTGNHQVTVKTPSREVSEDKPAVSAEDMAYSRAAIGKLKRCIKVAEEVREEFLNMRKEHVRRIEGEDRHDDAHGATDTTDTNQQAQTSSRRGLRERLGLKKGHTHHTVEHFSSSKLKKLKTKKAVMEEKEATKSALQEYEETRQFAALTKQEQLKRNIWRRGVPARDIKSYLDDELAQEQACIGLIWAVLMLVFFCMGVFSHMRLEEAHAEDYAVVFDLTENANFAFSGSIPYENGRMGHKGMDDINSIPDFWSWMNLGLVPLLFPAEGSWDTNEMRSNAAAMCSDFRAALDGFGGYDAAMLSGTTNTTGIHGEMNYDGGCPEAMSEQPSWPEGFLDVPDPPGGKDYTEAGHTYLYYHTIVGGVRMQQEYLPVETCPDEILKGSVYTGNCVSGSSPNYMLEPEPAQAFFPWDEQYLNTSMTVFLNAHTSQSDLRAQLRELEDKSWLSPHTAKVEMVYITYNPNLNSMTVVFINIFLNRAGHIHKITEPISFFLEPYQKWSEFVWDILWTVMVLKLAVDEIPDLCSNIREHGGCWAGLKSYASLGNAIDWINLVYSGIICFSWYVHLMNIKELNDMLEVANVETVGTWETDEERNAFFTQAVDVVQWQYMWRRLISFYPLLVVFKFLKVCSYSPRLALMTKTLSQASVDIFHFGVVFSTMFLIYTISGMLLFGQELLMFSTLERAVDATFKIVMGDFDWDEMRRIGRLEAWIWFFTFMLLVNLIMLNMLVAIIMDVYAEVKSALPPDADTLWSQLYEVIDRKTAVYYYGTRVSLRKIHDRLKLHDDDTKAHDEDEDHHIHDLDLVRFIAMSPEEEDGDEWKLIVFNLNFKSWDDTVTFGLDYDRDNDVDRLLIQSVNEAGCSTSCAVRVGDDGLEFDKKLDEAKFEPCYEGYRVMKVQQGPDETTNEKEMLDALEATKAEKGRIKITIRKTHEAIEDTHDIEGFTNTLKKIKVSSNQAKIVLEAALKHAEAQLNNGSSLAQNNIRIAKISDVLDEVQLVAKDIWKMVKPKE